MPELPDLEYIVKRVEPALTGRSIAGIHVRESIVIRNSLGRKLEDALPGLVFERVFRHGPFLHFSLGAVDLVIHPMLAGRFWLGKDAEKPRGAGLCFQLQLDAGVFAYLDTKKMGKAYVNPAGSVDSIPRYTDQGLPLLSPEFTEENFRKIAQKRKRQQTRVFLMDQTNFSAIGNAYADEILFAARIHPKTLVSQLNYEELHSLFTAMGSVIQWGIEAVAAADEPIDVKVRDHVKVRNRRDEPCPNCGTKIRRVAVLGHDAFFCPQCQPTGRKQFIDWQK